MQQPLRERLQFGNAAHLAALARLEQLPKLLAGWRLAYRRRTRNGQPVKPRACWCLKFVEHKPGHQDYRRPGGQWAHAGCVDALRREFKDLKAKFDA